MRIPVAFRFRLRTLLIAVAVIAAVLAFYPYFVGVYWVGQTNLQVTFLVKNTDTGLPIGGATIRCRRHECGLCLEDRDPEEEEFTLTTDSEGKAARKWTHCMCFGTTTRWRDTFVVHLPPLSFTEDANRLHLKFSLVDPPKHAPHNRGSGAPEAGGLEPALAGNSLNTEDHHATHPVPDQSPPRPLKANREIPSRNSGKPSPIRSRSDAPDAQPRRRSATPKTSRRQGGRS